MAEDRYAADPRAKSNVLTADQRGVTLTNPTIPGYSEGGGSSSSGSSSSFQGIDNPAALQILMDFIQQAASGGTEEQKRQRAERNAQIQSARGTLGDYTKQSAFTDAADLMAQNLRKSLEANMPAIAKSIQGAGTSASSMQGLLSQKLATESAQAAGALGAEQARSYGTISAQLQSVLEALTRIDPSVSDSLLKALDLTKVSKQSQSQQSTTAPTKTVTASGGGTAFYPFSEESLYNKSPSILYGNPTISPTPGAAEGYILNNDTGVGTSLTPGNAGQTWQLPTYGPSVSYDYSPAKEEDQTLFPLP